MLNNKTIKNKKMRKAVFLDRDGVLIEDKDGFVHKIEDFKLIEKAIDGLKILSKHFDFFIITNQSGIGRRVFTYDDFNIFNEHLIEQLEKNNIKIKKTYCCPHIPEDNCKCRKPSHHFLLEASKEFGIDLSRSYFIGDKPTDAEAGKKAGCKTIHILTGYEGKYKNVECDNVAKDLVEAAQWIIENEKNFATQNFFPLYKTKTIKDLETIIKELKKNNKKIVTTNGVFDILHIGHIRYLQKAKSLGDVLIVAVNSDASVKKIKGYGRPINDENDRAETLCALSCVDYVAIFNEENPIKILSIIRPNVHVKGGDYDINRIIEKDIVEKNNGKVVLMPLEKGYSTTSLIHKIRNTL